MITRKHWDGKRLESLTHDEMKALLTSRVEDFVKSGFSVGHNGVSRAYTHHIQIIVEILNAILKHGNYGDGIDEILLAATDYTVSTGALVITRKGVEPSLYGRVEFSDQAGCGIVNGVKMFATKLLRLS